jgi:hypothetical protein
VGANPPKNTHKEKDIPDYHRAYIKGATFFFTVVTHKRLPIFRKRKMYGLYPKIEDNRRQRD